VAAIVDSIALVIAWEIIQLFLPGHTPPAPPKNPQDLEAVIAYLNTLFSPIQLIASVVLIWAYFAFQESSRAEATLGKRMLGIRVANDAGNRLSLAAASIRAWPMYLPHAAWLVSFWLGNLVTLVAFIACVSVAFSGRKQGLHDKMAGAILTRP
jgi:uncharacterized RDD family membrane protein YckC